MQRHSLTIAGESGMGLLSTGDIVIKTLKRLGFYVNADREYPSLIKGGHSNYCINFSKDPIHSLSEKTDILIAMDEPGMRAYLPMIKKGGILIHGYERHNLIKELTETVEKNELKVLYLPARQISFSFGGNELMVNMVLLGLLWRTLGLPMDQLREEVSERFASKPKILEIDLKCLESGHQAEGIENIPELGLQAGEKIPNKILIDGNKALALGAIHAGIRNYYAYPMSPSSSILSYIAETYHQTGIIVKQAEDEITAVQMTIGSMHVGSRALVATSGGGFDLMTETVSLAAITEIPLVVVIAQRPGPATGLPTWTAQADLNLAIHAGHGEFPRVVIACSDPLSAFNLIQHAFNLSEKFQIPVIVLTEKVVAETQQIIDTFPLNLIPIDRGLVTKPEALENLKPENRFEITENGISQRWIPGSSDSIYFANGDEHWVDGTLTEDAEKVEAMIDKRMKKSPHILKALPEPEIIGPKTSGADISFIGWGSSKNVIRDAITEASAQGKTVNYLHFDYVWPLKTEALNKFFSENSNIHAIEGNYSGQLAQIIEDKTKNTFKGKFLKFDGRSFSIEEVTSYINKNS